MTTKPKKKEQGLTEAEKGFLKHPEEYQPAEMRNLWLKRCDEPFSANREVFEGLSVQLLKRGEPLLAYDVIKSGLKRDPDWLRLRQLLGLALARGGDTRKANEVLFTLYREGDRSEETLGLLGRTHKDLWLQAKGSREGNNQLLTSNAFYREAFLSFPGAYWSGINAATTAFLAGKKKEAGGFAEKTMRICQALEAKRSEKKDQYWLFATLGEAFLIRGEIESAISWYKRAFCVVQNRWGDLAATRRNARLLVESMGLSWDILAGCFEIPPVAVFSGHMVDKPGRPVPRFPEFLAPRVKQEIRTWLKKIRPGFVYASGACGGDILFLECALELNAEAHVVLPFAPDQFEKESVIISGNPTWLKRFRKVMKKVQSCSIASEGFFDAGGSLFEYANVLLNGMALDKSHRLETAVHPLAVWNEQAGDGTGGTESVVRFWRDKGLPVKIINPLKFLPNAPVAISSGRKKPEAVPLPAGKPVLDIGLKAILFADAVHFSRLQERQIPLFVQDFLGLIGDHVKETPYQPAMKNTWGDGIFFVFLSTREAGLFALDLMERINTTNWPGKGLPEGLNLRIALHAGPVFSFNDPVTLRTNYFGGHVNRAARIEPIAPPGQVYASENFIALAAAEGVREYSWSYVGKIPLAKSFGLFPLYHLQKADTIKVSKG